MTGQERLIVALDVGIVDDALRIVDELAGVRVFKVGWRLLMAGLRSGGLDRLWREVTGGARTVFVDLKVPDIGNTVASVVGDLADDPAVPLPDPARERAGTRHRGGKGGARRAGDALPADGPVRISASTRPTSRPSPLRKRRAA